MVGITVAVVLSGASVLLEATPARADQAGAVRGSVKALVAQATSGAQRVRVLTLAYDQANITATSLSQQVTADRVHLTQLQLQLSSTRQVLHDDAVISYTDGTAAQAPALGGSAEPSIRDEYLEVAAGDIDDVVDQYCSEEQAVTNDETDLNRQEAASRAAIEATARARAAALADASSEQAELDRMQANLTQLTAAIPAASQPVTQGLPVNGGVVAVVRQIVTSPPPVPIAPAPTQPGGAATGGVWLQLRECESGDNYREDTGNGFYGAYQFTAQTWTGLGYPGRPDLEPPSMQDQAAIQLQRRSGWGQWPACSAALGLT